MLKSRLGSRNLTFESTPGDCATNGPKPIPMRRCHKVVYRLMAECLKAFGHLAKTSFGAA